MKNNKKFILGMVSGIIIAVFVNVIVNNGGTAFRKLISGNITTEEKILEIATLIDNFYINEYDQNFMEEMIYKGMVASLQDPYSYYMGRKEFNDFIQKSEGNYVGIGVMVNLSDDGKININKVFDNSPAKQSDIRVGDKIIKVFDKEVNIENYSSIIGDIKGEEGTKVSMSINRNGTILKKSVERKGIEIPTVTFDTVAKNIGYIKIEQFDRVTYEQFKHAFDTLKDTKGLIIDLRDNPGGYLETVNKIADILLPEGTITYIEDKKGNKEYYKSNAEDVYKKPLMVLVNGNSASASEVLAGAIKDYKIGKLIGSQTYGKGVVQNMYTLSDGSGVKVTIAKYYTPNGICIDGIGIAPDYKIEDDKDDTKDLELQKAIELINSVD